MAEDRSGNKPDREPPWTLRNCEPNTLRMNTLQHRSDFSFRRDVAENCALLGHYAASSGNLLDDVSGQPVGPIFKSAVLISEPQFYELHVRRYSQRLSTSTYWATAGYFPIVPSSPLTHTVTILLY
jgi:hypothetical protein